MILKAELKESLKVNFSLKWNRFYFVLCSKSSCFPVLEELNHIEQKFTC